MPKKLYDSLLEIPGMGSTLAKKLVDAGLKSIRQLKSSKYYDMLPNEVKLSVKYDLSRKRDKPWDLMNSLVHNLPKKLVPVGSFRRKKPLLKDLDLITLEDLSKMHKNIVALSKKDVGDPSSDFARDQPYEVLESYSVGSKKYSFVIKFKGKYIRVDLFRINDRDEMPFALLHYTGDQGFNIKLRMHAKRQGYKLNQYGLFDKDNNKVNIPLPKSGRLTEKKIMQFLNFKYEPPENRNN